MRKSGSVLWTTTLPFRASPVHAHIRDDGRYVVLQDEWHHVGYGKVLALIGPGGRILRTYTLEQILTEEEILRCPITISSRWWSSDALFFFRTPLSQFAFMTASGTIRTFDLRSGKPLPVTARRRRGIQRDALKIARRYLINEDAVKRGAAAAVIRLLRDRESIPQARNLLKSTDMYGRIDGIELVAALGDRSSLPSLKRLLDDTTSTSSRSINRGPYLDIYGVQLAAGRALVSLLGRNAVPLLEAKLPEANEYMVQDWIELLADTGIGDESQKLVGLIHSENEGIRRAAARALLEEDDGPVARRHLEWARHSDEDVRFRVIRAIAEKPLIEDAGLLREALGDSHDTTASWALRGLLRLNPPDMLALLKQAAERKGYTRRQALVELALRRDPGSTQELIEWVRNLEKHTHDEEGWGTQEMFFAQVSKALAEVRPEGYLEALLRAQQNSCEDIQRSACGALAALGDRAALERTRGFARKGHDLDRSDAITWLGICRDHDSIPFLESCLKDKVSWIRNSAREALKAINNPAN